MNAVLAAGGGGFLVLVLVLVILWILASCIKIVPQAQAVVLERLGGYRATWSVGVHFKTPFIDRVAKYTDKVYVTSLCVDYDNDEYTSMNGNIVVTSGMEGVSVKGSANDTMLKETEWFEKNRKMPSGW